MPPKKRGRKKEPPKPWQNEFEGLSPHMETFVEGCKSEIYAMRVQKMKEEIERVGTGRGHHLALTKGGHASVPEELSKLKGLLVLELAHNLLDESTIHPSLWTSPDMRSLKVLDLSNNNISTLPVEIGNLINLEVLDLHRNQLSTQERALPAELGMLHRLREVTLSQNEILDLPESLANWRKLEYLDISHNKISTLPNHCHLWSELEVLIAKGNKMVTLPVGVGGWMKVRKLNFSKCELVEQLPSEIKHWHCLEEFDASYNDIPSLPDEFHQLTTLRKLYLSHNLLKTSQVVGFANFSLLEDLFLSKNLLEKGIPKEFGQLTNLRRVALARNKMRSLPTEVGEWRKVEEVYLSANDIERLPSSVANWSCLRELVCSNCENLAVIPAGLADIKSLLNLDLRETPAELPEEFSKISARIPPLYIRISGVASKGKGGDKKNK
eukprot:TRINITY_DN1419_c0_g1_i3.p1 TRINITY_DN1419_c0_g1~~TRINITY_DN1419_c0_g1_i3.p1  ORF type:complete len:439 (-),score=115.71 TRINITY_DN1419_c0_g1_i3:3-1319(-)